MIVTGADKSKRGEIMETNQHTGPGHDELRESLGLYLSGTLDPAEERRVEAHLAGCAECRATADELADVVLLLPNLSNDDMRDLLTPDRPESPEPGHVAPFRRPSPARRRGRMLAPLLAAAAALVAIAFAGGAWWNGSYGPASRPVSSSTSAGATASVEFPIDRELRLVVVGLRPRAEFEVIAVARDGKPHLLARHQAIGGPQRVVAETPVPADEIVLVIVAQLDGTVVVAVPL